ncbi:MAG: Rossmann-like and DUF2520 domain-containing protein [Candidatus Dormibacteria bacterium]
MDQQVNRSTSPARAHKRPSIGIVGAGRAGSAIAVALHQAGYPVVAVSSRSETSAAELSAAVGGGRPTTPPNVVRRAELTFLTVPDAEISGTAAALASVTPPGSLRGRTLVHCSAGRDREALAPARVTGAAIAGLHPLQALTGSASAASLRGAAFALDADALAAPPLEQLVADLGGTVLPVAPDQRAAYHAAAVLAGNAPLALLARAVQLLTSTGTEPELASRALAGLFAGAAANAVRLGAGAALTGPVARDDAATVAQHLDALEEQPQLQQLYRTLALETLRLAGIESHPEVAALLGEREREPRLRRVTAA